MGTEPLLRHPYGLIEDQTIGPVGKQANFPWPSGVLCHLTEKHSTVVGHMNHSLGPFGDSPEALIAVLVLNHSEHVLGYNWE